MLLRCTRRWCLMQCWNFYCQCLRILLKMRQSDIECWPLHQAYHSDTQHSHSKVSVQGVMPLLKQMLGSTKPGLQQAAARAIHSLESSSLRLVGTATRLTVSKLHQVRYAQVNCLFNLPLEFWGHALQSC